LALTFKQELRGWFIWLTTSLPLRNRLEHSAQRTMKLRKVCRQLPKFLVSRLSLLGFAIYTMGRSRRRTHSLSSTVSVDTAPTSLTPHSSPRREQSTIDPPLSILSHSPTSSRASSPVSTSHGSEDGTVRPFKDIGINGRPPLEAILTLEQMDRTEDLALLAAQDSQMAGVVEAECVLGIKQAEREVLRAEQQLIYSRLKESRLRTRLLRVKSLRIGLKMRKADMAVGSARIEIREAETDAWVPVAEPNPAQMHSGGEGGLPMTQNAGKLVA
jgi:hypothetical protein